MAEAGPPTRGCARCGLCCTGITMVADFDPVTYDPTPGTDAEIDIAFILKHWTKSAAEDDPAASDAWPTWSCDKFDPVHALCTAHEDRPPVCSGYPWYGKEPGPERAAKLYNCCSYLADLPPGDRPEDAWPLIPIEVVQR